MKAHERESVGVRGCQGYSRETPKKTAQVMRSQQGVGALMIILKRGAGRRE